MLVFFSLVFVVLLPIVYLIYKVYTRDKTEEEKREIKIQIIAGLLAIFLIPLFCVLLLLVPAFILIKAGVLSENFQIPTYILLPAVGVIMLATIRFSRNIAERIVK